jgi:alpha-galactosidase
MRLLATLSISSLALACFLFVPLRGQAIPPELQAADAPPHTIWLESLDLTKSVQSFGTAQVDKTPDNNSLKLGGVAYPHGVGVNSKARMVIDLHGAATHFESLVGVDNDSTQGSVTFTVLVDGKKVQETGVLHGKDQAQLISVDLTGAKRLVLIVGDGNDGIEFDHADWAGAQIALVPGATEKPETIPVPAEVPRMTMLEENPQTAIHGARIIGTTPGRFFLFSISATGTAPLAFAAENLPDGLTLDPKTGIITGSLKQAGSTDVKLTVTGPGGEAHRVLTIVGGDHKLDLTPQMGWNSWNVWGNTVTEQKVKDAADEMISAGLQAHGYQYVNIDQGWQGKRDAQGNIQSNSDFPDMKGLSDYVHGKGLRIGIYSSPGPQTCGPYEGSYQHEDQDAQTYANWGFDYLKYDWCTYEDVVKGDHSVPTLQKPYAVMRASLDKVNRDLVFSLCQYGMGNSWTWAADPPILGNSWRTNGDIMDNWGSLYSIIENEVGHEKYAGPGHWNDPDMLMVGIVGFGNTHPTGLSPNEQITHISMWCMFSSPLLIGCDMTKFDPFTRAILTNDEALDINQDPLGKPASRISKDANLGEVWSRELSDGTRAVTLLNGGADEQKLTVRFSDIGLSGKQPVRDLWLHQNVDSSDDGYSVVVPTHGTVLLKIGTPQK